MFPSQTQWLPNCWRERVGGGVTQQNFTIGQGAGAKTRPLTHPAGPPIIESLKFQHRHPSSMLCLSPTSGNSPEPAAATFIRRSKESQLKSAASTVRVRHVVLLCPLPPRDTLTPPEWPISGLDATLTTQTDTCYRWAMCQNVCLYACVIVSYFYLSDSVLTVCKLNYVWLCLVCSDLL